MMPMSRHMGPEVTAAELAKRMKTVTDYVRDCERRVSLGEIMELDGLDRNVMELCDAIASLPKDDSVSLERQMSSLIENLETLADAMRIQQDKVAAEEEGKA